jgi:DNA (cytosine-5)-methyltransferase 1
VNGLIVDLFAGGGGASAGLEAALGRPVDIAINHDPIALAVHKANHPDTQHLDADIWEVKPREATQGREVAVLWASPDCTHFSVAKGDVPRSQNIRSLAWAVVRWAKAVRPRVIFLENVTEFRGWGPLRQDGKPDKSRMGQTFRRWCSTLQGLGYVVDYRVLDASLYGAPTRRRRLFMVARCDGQPIRWPAPTHGPGLAHVHTAAECIDWSIPCPSIFERKRPLAEKTLWRIAQGIRRFVLDSPAPFVVRMAHGEVAPDGVTKRRGHGAQPAADPLPTITGSSGGGGFAIATPSLVEMTHSNAPRGVDEPLGVVTTQHNRFNIVAPHLVKVNHGKREARGEQLDLPLSTVTATQRGHALVAPTLIQAGYGERKAHHGRGPDQPARVLDLGEPLGTIVAQGRKHALVSAFLARHFGGMVGADLGGSLHTITSKDHHSVVTASLEATDDGSRSGSTDDRHGSDRGASGRDGVEAAESQRHPTARTEARRDSEQARLPDGASQHKLPRVPAGRASSGVDGSQGADPVRHGHQPQGRQADEQPSRESGAGDAQREPSARLQGAGPTAVQDNAEADPGGDRTGGQSAASAGAFLRRHRPSARDSADDGVPSNPHGVADHTREVRAFLTAFYGSDGTAGKGQGLRAPLRTLTAKHRLGLVTVEGIDYQVVDIGMRMLEPHELLRAQFGRFADLYDLSAARTKAAKVRLIGNSVCPEAAEALVIANKPETEEEAVA